MVQIIALHFSNCEVNSCYCNCKVANHAKSVKQSTLNPFFFFLIHCILLSKEILLIPKIKLQNEKNGSQFLKLCLQQAKSLSTLGIFIAN